MKPPVINIVANRPKMLDKRMESRYDHWWALAFLWELVLSTLLP